MSDSGVESLTDSLKSEALETMFHTAGWRVAKWHLDKLAAGHKSRALTATSEMEAMKALGAMAALESAAHSIEQTAEILKKKS
jgi:hypothetical protein